jgi:hypothetical protein
MWSAEGQLESVVEKHWVATFPLQTAQNMAGKHMNIKMLQFPVF